MQYFVFLLVALVAGALLPFQAGLNAELGRAVKSPVYAALISFLVGTAGLILYLLAVRTDWSQWTEARNLSWYYWVGGLIGAFYVAAVIILAPKLGTALTFGLTVAGQMAVSLVLDHYGLLGLPENPVNWVRVLAIALIVGGVVMLRVY